MGARPSLACSVEFLIRNRGRGPAILVKFLPLLGDQAQTGLARLARIAPGVGYQAVVPASAAPLRWFPPGPGGRGSRTDRILAASGFVSWSRPPASISGWLSSSTMASQVVSRPVRARSTIWTGHRVPGLGGGDCQRGDVRAGHRSSPVDPAHQAPDLIGAGRDRRVPIRREGHFVGHLGQDQVDQSGTRAATVQVRRDRPDPPGPAQN